MDIENEKIRTENNLLKDEIQKYKEDDYIKNKKEVEELKNKYENLDKEKNDINEKYIKLQKDFNHDLFNSTKVRAILDFLIKNNQMMEKKINEYNNIKINNEKKNAQLQQTINEKNMKIEEKEKMMEDIKKKLNEEKNKYIQLNKEYTNILNLSKQEPKNIENDKDGENKKIKDNFNLMLKSLNKCKEIIPFLINKLDTVQKENNDLKEQLNKINKDGLMKNNDIIKNKDKEIDELKNQIKNINSNNENIMKQFNIVKTENNLIKEDMILIGNSMNKKEENISEENYLNEILNQLMKARGIISFLMNDK